MEEGEKMATRKSKLDAYRDVMTAWLTQEEELTQTDIKRRLMEKFGVSVADSTLSEYIRSRLSPDDADGDGQVDHAAAILTRELADIQTNMASFFDAVFEGIAKLGPALHEVNDLAEARHQDQKRQLEELTAARPSGGGHQPQLATPLAEIDKRLEAMEASLMTLSVGSVLPGTHRRIFRSAFWLCLILIVAADSSVWLFILDRWPLLWQGVGWFARNARHFVEQLIADWT
jgi:hypothetical protein